MPTLAFSLARNSRDNTPRRTEIAGWAQIRAVLEHGRISAKDGPAWCVATFGEGYGQTPRTSNRIAAWRQRHLVQGCQIWGLDVDGTTRGVDDAICRIQRALGMSSAPAHAIYTTWSDGVVERETVVIPRKYRLMIPLSRPVTADEYEALGRWLCSVVDDDAVDVAASSDPARLFYLPRARNPASRNEQICIVEDGDWLDVDSEYVNVKAKAQALIDARTKRNDDVVTQWRSVDVTAMQGSRRVIVDELVDSIATAKQRRPAFFRAACTVGGMVAVGMCDDADAQRMEDVCVAALADRLGAQHDDGDARRQWRNGMEHGKRNPPAPPQAVKSMAVPSSVESIREYLPLDDARDRLLEIVRRAVKSKADTAVISTPGVGKTRAVHLAAIDAWRDGRSSRIVLPTNRAIKEQTDALRRLYVDAAHDAEWQEAEAFDAAVVVAPARTRDTCQIFDVVEAADRAHPQGASLTCSACDLNPRNNQNPVRECTYWREQNRRFAREARAQKAGKSLPVIMLTTHELEARTHRKRASVVVVDHRAINSVVGIGEELERYRPTARWGADGRMVLAIARAADDEYGETIDDLVDDPLGEACAKQWFAAYAGRPCDWRDDDQLIAKYESIAGERNAFVAVDENPAGALHTSTSCTIDDIALWRGHGDLTVDDDAFSRLRDAMGAGTALTSWSLASLAPSGSIIQAVSDDNWHGIKDTECDVSDAAHGDTEAVERLRRRPAWRTLAALQAACERAWRGCSVDRHGRLTILEPRQYSDRGTDCVLYLDGTATKATVEALFGSRMAVHDVRAALHPDSTVQRVEWSAHRRRIEDDGSTRSDKDLERLTAIVGQYESPSTLWVLHKAWLESSVIKGLLADAIADERVTYHGAPDAIGSNRHEHLTRVVVASWHVPQAAVGAIAETYQAQAGGESQAEWQREAAYQTETAKVEQAIHRIRPCAQPREIVLLDTRIGLRICGVEATPIDVDLLALRESGAGRIGALYALIWDIVQRKQGFAVVASLNGMLPNSVMAELLNEMQRDLARGHGREWVVYWMGDAPTARQVADAISDQDPTAREVKTISWRGVALHTRFGTVHWQDQLATARELGEYTWRGLAVQIGVSEATVRRHAALEGIRTADELRAAIDSAAAVQGDTAALGAGSESGTVIVVRGASILVPRVYSAYTARKALTRGPPTASERTEPISDYRALQGPYPTCIG